MALHVGLLILALTGGRQDGSSEADSQALKVVLIPASKADRREGVELTPLEPAVPTPPIEEQLQKEQLQAAIESVTPPEEMVAPEPEQAAPPSEPQVEQSEAVAAIIPIEVPSTFAMPQAEKAALSERLEELAEKALAASEAEVTWEENGKSYSAVLIRERASDGTALERVIAEVSASDRGRLLTTRVNLNRLAFSQFTQMVDHWDPMVQLHDDEIVGRFHSNSRFRMMYDSRTAPKFIGKVTTAARSFDSASNGRRRDSDIFQGGVETRTSPIPLPESLQPFEWAPKDGDVRIHELASDTRIRFFADGSYTWRTRESSQTEYLNEPSGQPVYFVGARNTTLYVAGVVAGKFLVYSPQRIVIEGNLKYASDPRKDADSTDYLGVVCDRYVEIAPPSVTGPGDVEIHAAIFAGRRFIVTHIDHPRSATLRIYGSLAAGTLSATEPRYATRIDYDDRFERQRPPGFPSTNRYEVDDWDGQWTEVQDRTASESF